MVDFGYAAIDVTLEGEKVKLIDDVELNEEAFRTGISRLMDSGLNLLVTENSSKKDPNLIFLWNKHKDKYSTGTITLRQVCDWLASL